MKTPKEIYPKTGELSSVVFHSIIVWNLPNFVLTPMQPALYMYHCYETGSLSMIVGVTAIIFVYVFFIQGRPVLLKLLEKLFEGRKYTLANWEFMMLR